MPLTKVPSCQNNGFTLLNCLRRAWFLCPGCNLYQSVIIMLNTDENVRLIKIWNCCICYCLYFYPRLFQIRFFFRASHFHNQIVNSVELVIEMKCSKGHNKLDSALWPFEVPKVYNHDDSSVCRKLGHPFKTIPDMVLDFYKVQQVIYSAPTHVRSFIDYLFKSPLFIEYQLLNWFPNSNLLRLHSSNTKEMEVRCLIIAF